MPFQNYDVYIESDGVTKGFLIKTEEGLKQYQVGLAPTLAPQQRLSSVNLYEGQPPEVSVTSASETWHGGAGRFDASGHPGTEEHAVSGYNYSRGIDLSEEHRVYLSPYRNTTVTANAAEFNGKPIQFLTSSFGTFCITERAIYVWNILDSVWEIVNESGNYKPGALEHDGYLYVPRGTSAYIYSIDGRIWTTSSRTTVDSQADAFCNRGDDGESSAAYNVIVRLRNNEVSASTDGINGGAAWSTEDAVGPTNETSKNITPSDNDVVIWKREGVYTFDFTNVDNFWSTSFANLDNADHVYQWSDGLFYANYGDTVIQFDFTNGTLKTVYPTAEMDSPELKGKIVGITGTDSHMFIGLLNADGRTYMMKGVPGTSWHSVAVFNIFLNAQKPTTSGSNDATVGSISWDDPNNIVTPDAAVASFTDGTSKYLLADTFGFSIPADAIVTGLVANIYKNQSPVAVSLIDSQSAQSTGTTTITWAHTCSGSNRLLLVGLTYSEGVEGVYASGITFNGTGLTLQNRVKLSGYTFYDTSSSSYVSVTSDVWSEVWSLIAPTSTTSNIVATFSGTTSAWGTFPITFPHTWGVAPVCASASFDNVNQTTPLSTVSSDSASGAGDNSVSVGITTTNSSYAFAIASAFGISTISSTETTLENVTDALLSIAEAQTAASQQLTATKSGSGSLYIAGYAIAPISGDVEDNSVKWFKDGVVAGSDLADADSWPTSLSLSEYGSSSSINGFSITPSQVNSAAFGIGISATATGGSVAKVDYVEVTVYWYVPNDIPTTRTISMVAPGAFLTENPCLLSGYTNSAVYYIQPRSGMKPGNDSNYLFQTQEEEIVVGSWIDFGGSAYNKFLNRGTILGENITSGKAVTLSYETDRNASGEIVTAKQSSLSAGNVSTKIEFNRIRYNLTMNTTSASTSPIALGWTLQATLNQPRYRVWTFTLDLSNEQVLLEGNQDFYQDSIALESFLFNATRQRPVFTDILGNSYNVRIADLQSVGFNYHINGNEERFGMLYRIQLLEIGPLSTQVSPLVYGSNAWGRERDWS